ncbi:UNKNOWN [Stylonychia lemnae]|uniref:Uncharacterized protein n=1 Tax=Stylonychia lemnae TaxID=5949 RepID=A0A078AN78_STYLE|nr:UNKNOWN [Stylonychia lemnae]|eukprot:CDW83619.1 UNKNOWN [Stylonychia lemnae]
MQQKHKKNQEIISGQTFDISILVKNDQKGLLKNVRTYIQSNQSVLEANITLNHTEQKYVGLYNFSVFYQISDPINQFNYIQNDFIVNIINPCNDEFKVLTEPVFPKVRQKIFDPQQEIEFSKLELAPYRVCYNQTVNIIKKGSLQPVESLINQAKIGQFNITIKSDQAEEIGTYQYQVIYNITSEISEVIPKILAYDLEVEIYGDAKVYISNNTAPYFLSPIPSYELQVGQRREIDMPEIKDDQGDNCQLTYQSKMDGLFLKIDKKKMIINAIYIVVGIQEVIVKLLDDNPFPLSAKFKFTITISQNTTNQYESVIVQNTDIYQEYKQSLKIQRIGVIKAKITQITNTGLVTIIFDQNLYELLKFTQKIQESINISLDYSDSSSEQSQNFIVLSYSNRVMTIQMLFQSIQNISKYRVNILIKCQIQEWDTLIVKFNYYFIFYDTSQKLMINKGYQIKGYIPPQISSGLKDFYDSIGSASSITVSSFMGTNLFINILMYRYMNLTIIGLRVSNYYGE